MQLQRRARSRHPLAVTARAEVMSLTDLVALRRRVDERLDALLPDATGTPALVYDAMRYSALAPGKRIRPLLTILTARHFDRDESAALDIGCAIEMVHTASLVLDDLPSMDNATLRRGREATHRRFGESTAILAAVALLNRAYGVISARDDVERDVRLRLIDLLSETIGPDGLIGGQVVDLQERARFVEADQVEALNHQKTGVLFVAAVESGARLAGADAAALGWLREFAGRLGLAFQTLDDLIDASASSADAGKDVRRDCDRPSLVSLIGEERARSVAALHLEAAQRALEACAPGRGPLQQFMDVAFARALVVS